MHVLQRPVERTTQSGHLTNYKWVRAKAPKGNLLKKVMPVVMKSPLLP